MIDFFSFGSLTLFGILIIYTIITLYNDGIKSTNSLRNTERLHRFFLLTGGILIGWGLGSQQLDFGEIEILSDEFLISILFAVAGVFLVLFGNLILKNNLWSPLENLSEYSAEFGTNFIATRLPETGGAELERFAARFNANVINLANDISILEIQVDQVTEAVASTIEDGKQLTSITSSLSDVALKYGSITRDQSAVVNQIGTQVGEFANWYSQTQENLQENFIELRSLSEMGNLIAINAAIEASNLEIPNPGFETLASKLRDLARSLEERQEALRRILDEISVNYKRFRGRIQDNISKALNLSSNTSNLGDQVDDIIQEISQKEEVFINSYNQLEKSITNFKEHIPTAYL